MAVILLATTLPCSVGARRRYRNSAKIEVPGGRVVSQQIFIQGGSARTFLHTIFNRKVPLPYTFY